MARSGGVVEVVGKDVGLIGDDGRQDARPRADEPLSFDAVAIEDGARQIRIEADDVLEIGGVTEEKRRGLRVATFLDRPTGEA